MFLTVALEVVWAVCITATAVVVSQYPVTELLALAVDLVKITNQVYIIMCMYYIDFVTGFGQFTRTRGLIQLFGTGESDDICLMGIFNETVYIVINNDSFVEGNEVFYIQLVLNSINSQVEIVNATITLVIIDDDGKIQ